MCLKGELRSGRVFTTSPKIRPEGEKPKVDLFRCSKHLNELIDGH